MVFLKMLPFGGALEVSIGTKDEKNATFGDIST